MRDNRLSRALKENRIAFGAVIHIPATAIVEIAGQAGFDFVMIDTEHGMYDLTMAGELIRAARGTDLTPIVRVLKNEPELIMKALDLGAQGIVVPHVSGRDDAIRAVEACRYGPAGRRGACPLVAAADYGLADWRLFQQAANQQTLVIVLVEDMTGVEHIDQILSVSGVDAIFLGAFDLSISAGFEGNVRHPAVQEALDRILECCRHHQRPAMITMTAGGDVDAWVRKGVRLVLQSADSYVYMHACRQFLASFAQVRMTAAESNA